MPSTYSPLLRLELIGAGEQSGLWGDTTNKNVGTLIEQAIAGVAEIPLTGGAGVYIVEALDGTQDQARCAVLKFTGAPSGAKDIQIPSTEKLYVVRNDSTQNITVKTSAQISNPLLGGVLLKPSEATLVFCDGTEAVAGIETAGVGTLGVSGGGTGQTTFATPGFLKTPGGQNAFTSVANIALDSSDTSGTLPVIKGGTGVTSAGTAGNALVSNGATWQSTPTVNTINAGTGISITGSAGNFTISTSGAASGVTSVSGSGNITVSPSTGNVNVSMSSAPTFSSYVTSPTYYVGSSPGSMYIQNVGGEMAFIVSGSQTAKVTNQGIGCNGLIAGPGSTIGDQRIKVSGAGMDSGISPSGLQTGASGWGIIYGTLPDVSIVTGGAFQTSFRQSGNFQSNNSPNWNTTSDINIKTNFRPVNNALSKLCALQPKHFEYKDDLGKTRTGFIAQEFETVFPGHTSETLPTEKQKEFLPEGVDKIKALDLNLIPYLVKAIQELKTELDAAKAEITELKAK